MAFTAGVTRATGDTILATDWNNYNGANGSIDYLNSTPGPLTYADFTTAAAPAAPGAGKVRLYAVTGDLLGIRVGAAGAAQVLESQANKNAASGYAGLDAGTLLTGTQVPNTHGASGVQTHHAQAHAVDSASDHSAGTQGDIPYAGAAGAWARLAAGTSGYFLKTQGAGANPTWAAVSSGALTRVGGQVGETTTTSTVADTSIIAISGLSIAAGTPLFLTMTVRKTSGAAAGARLRLKLNTTVAPFNEIDCFSATNQAEDGLVRMWFTYGVTNHLRAAFAQATSPQGNINNVDLGSAADMPTATLTDIAIVGRSLNSLVTFGVQNLHIYTYAVS